MKGWRTLAFNFFVGLVPILSMTEVIDIIPTDYLNTYMIAVAVANVVLRVVTTTPVGSKE